MADELWYFQQFSDFGQTLDSGYVAPLPPETVLYRAVYVGEGHEIPAGLNQARGRITTHHFHGRDDIYLLRPTTTASDGPPFRTVLIYRMAGQADVERISSGRRLATRYEPIRMGGSFAWESGHPIGRESYWLTGTGSTELWRLARLEPDALNRQVLTLMPVRLPHGLATPEFDVVKDPRLRAYLAEQFDGFVRAVASGAHFDVLDRAAHLAEGILDHCLTEAGASVPRTLGERLEAAKQLLDGRRQDFRLTDLAYHIAQRFRILNSRVHADQAVRRGRTVRPEVGMAAASDLSELLVEVGLARY